MEECFQRLFIEFLTLLYFRHIYLLATSGINGDIRFAVDGPGLEEEAFSGARRPVAVCLIRCAWSVAV